MTRPHAPMYLGHWCGGDGGCSEPPRKPSTQHRADPYRPGAQSTPKTLNGHKSGPLGRITTILGATKMYFCIAEPYAGVAEGPEKSPVGNSGVKVADLADDRTLAAVGGQILTRRCGGWWRPFPMVGGAVWVVMGAEAKCTLKGATT